MGDRANCIKESGLPKPGLYESGLFFVLAESHGYSNTSHPVGPTTGERFVVCVAPYAYTIPCFAGGEC